MHKSEFLTLRLDPLERQALERAAVADDRAASALARKLVTDWLRANGWMEDGK